MSAFPAIGFTALSRCVCVCVLCVCVCVCVFTLCFLCTLITVCSLLLRGLGPCCWLLPASLVLHFFLIPSALIHHRVHPPSITFQIDGTPSGTAISQQRYA